MIYLLSCNHCNVQYVGETTLPLHKTINLHRRVKFGCDLWVGTSFSVQIIDLFPGTGYKNNKMCPVNCKTRLDRETIRWKLYEHHIPMV